MAKQVLVQFRTDGTLKQQAAEIFEALGLDLPTAMRMFLTRSVQVKGLPFEARLPESTVTRADSLKAFENLRNQAKDLPKMSLEEINAEISAVRANRKG